MIDSDQESWFIVIEVVIDSDQESWFIVFEVLIDSDQGSWFIVIEVLMNRICSLDWIGSGVLIGIEAIFDSDWGHDW